MSIYNTCIHEVNYNSYLLSHDEELNENLK